MNKNILFGAVSGLFFTLFVLFNLNTAFADTKKLSPQEIKQQRTKAFDKLARIIATIEANYVDEVSIEDIVNKSIEGLLSNLDAHSAYLDDKKFKELKMQTDGEFGGLGITIGMRDGAITIISPIDDTPAQKAGLKSGDVILKINEKNTLGMGIDDAVNLMRGKPKTSITLTIVRKGESKPLEFKMQRDIIKVKSVVAKPINDTPYLYVRISSFDRNVSDSLRNALKENPKTEGLILDLRNNPGGLLDQAVEVSRLFVENGVIVSQKGKTKSENLVYNANGKAPYKHIPIVVLVNGGSASASEIVAGALQDHKKALIIGEDTFGKGSVQMVLPISSTEAIKLTTAKYYLPSGRTIQAVGIKPDIVVHAGAVPQGFGGFELKESELKNHLLNELEKVESKTENKDELNENKTINQAIIDSDIQLKSGIDALKTWKVLTSKPKLRQGESK